MRVEQNGTARPEGGVLNQRVTDLGVLRPAPRSWTLRNLLRHRRRDLPKVALSQFLGRLPGVVTMEARLSGDVYRIPAGLAPWQLEKIKNLLQENFDVKYLAAYFGGLCTEYGTLSRRVVTTAGVGYIVDAFQNLVELENMKFHGYGTGTTAEANGDTALVTELTTQYATDSTRPTGTTTEGASANIYRSVATLSPDSGGTIAVTEHGIFSASSAGVLLDRSVFAAVNLVAGSDSLQTTYDLTVSAGG